MFIYKNRYQYTYIHVNKNMHVYIYIYTGKCIHVNIYIYIYMIVIVYRYLSTNSCLRDLNSLKVCSLIAFAGQWGELASDNGGRQGPARASHAYLVNMYSSSNLKSV